MSNMPSGSHISGEMSAIVPVKPAGATPTTVKSSELILMVWPSSSRFAWLTMTTGTRAVGRSSSMVNARPASSGTPSASK